MYFFIRLACAFLLLSTCLIACHNSHSGNHLSNDTAATLSFTDTFLKGQALIQSDTAKIANKQFVLEVYRKDTNICFIVKKWDNTSFKVILRDPTYGTNNSDLYFEDKNNDGYLDIVWLRKWQEHAYLYNPAIENFIEVGEFHGINALKIDNKPVLYKNKYPLLYYWNYEKPFPWPTCQSEDTMFSENHSELFIIDENYNKISFAVLDNFSTLNHDSLECGTQVITCYVPPYYGKFGLYNIWNNGVVKDSFLLKPQSSFWSDEMFAIDSAYITNYWVTNYSKYLPYGQVFKVRREKPLEYYK